MRLGLHTNGISCEYDMQDKLEEWLNTKEYIHFREVRVPRVHRIADFIIKHPSKGLINIEAKCLDFKEVLAQMDDHSTYCDYCFAFIPDYAPTPKWFKQGMLEKNYGLIIFNYRTSCITEVFEAHKNKITDKITRLNLLAELQNGKSR